MTITSDASRSSSKMTGSNLIESPYRHESMRKKGVEERPGRTAETSHDNFQPEDSDDCKGSFVRSQTLPDTLP